MHLPFCIENIDCAHSRKTYERKWVNDFKKERNLPCIKQTNERFVELTIFATTPFSLNSTMSVKNASTGPLGASLAENFRIAIECSRLLSKLQMW